MTEIEVPLGERAYRVIVEAGALARVGELVRRQVRPAPTCVAVIADDRVWQLHGDALRSGLERELAAAIERSLPIVCVPPGEPAKDLAVFGQVLDGLASQQLDRGAVVIALGGGTTGDLAGFVAATLLRGIRFVNVPTTLLADVDAAIGGKTGINLRAGKNLAGAFHQPSLVVIDPALLATLPAREFASGVGEIVKYGLIDDPAILDLLARGKLDPARDEGVLGDLVARCVRIKARVVAEDEREGSVRAHLNLGHTFAHAIERAQDYRGLLHGEAVGLGLVAACRLSTALLGCDRALADRVDALLDRHGLPRRVALSADAILTHMGADKKRHRGELRFVLLEQLGVPRVVPVTDLAPVREAIAAIL